MGELGVYLVLVLGFMLIGCGLEIKINGNWFFIFYFFMIVVLVYFIFFVNKLGWFEKMDIGVGMERRFFF